MNFSHPYYKLGNRIFTTLRRNNSYKVGKSIPIYLNHQTLFHAKVLHTEWRRLTDIAEGVLLADCLYPNSEIKNRQDCYDLIQSFYKKKINFEKEKFVLIVLLRSKKEPKLNEWTPTNRIIKTAY